MQQTILGVLALLVVGSYTLTQNRNAARSYNDLVDDELEIAASGVAMHVMELVGNRAFDERTLPEEVDARGLISGAAELTSASAFGKAAGCDLDEPFKDQDPCLDIDDVDMLDDIWQEVPFRLKDGKELRFDIHVDVFYVDPSNFDQPLPVGQRSLNKKVVVKVRSKRHMLQNRYKDGFVRIERIFSYDRKRSENRWMDEFILPGMDEVVGADMETVEEGGDNNGGDVYDTEETVEDDPNSLVTICHRFVRRGKINWSTKNVKNKFVAKHIGHGDYLGSCN